MNSSNSLFNKQVPGTEELIEFVSQNFALEKNEEPFHRQALAFAITKFVLHFDGKESFWRRDNVGTDFPWDDYKTTLTKFLGERSLWKSVVNNNLKQEHLCVLFYIAALRYRALPLPILQKKYDKDNQSQNPHTDLFLFDGNGEKKAAFAVQPRLLTKSDMEPSGDLNHASYRSSEYLGKDLASAQAVRHEGVASAQSFTYSLNNKGAKTRNFVVSVNPYKTDWDDCGVYEETLTSQTLDSAQIQIRPQNQMDPNQNTNNNSSYIVQNNNMNPPQNSQSPPSSQDQASQGPYFGQSYFKNKTKESQISPKKSTNQSYLIIPNNSRDPIPTFNHFSVKQLKSSSSYNQTSQKTSKPTKYSAKVNQNSQNEDSSEENAMMNREERQVSHPILRRNGFKKQP